jgi:hypothetical protein
MMAAWQGLFERVEAFPSSIAIRESAYFYPFLLTSHVVGMCLFAGLVIMMDLRLMGMGNTGTPLSQIQRRLFPLQMLGFVLSALTGLLLVYAQPMRFYGNVFFWIKSVMMAVAGVNVLAFHLGTYRSVATWDAEARPPFGARLSGALSLVLWALVIVSGRLIAYNWFR